MTRCEVCGNEYDKSFQVIAAGVSYVFDSIECAATVLAPQCGHCKCRILGHAVEANDQFFCCTHCAKQAGEKRLKAHV